MNKHISYLLITAVFVATGFARAQERQSWLPSGKSKTEATSSEVNNFLRPLNGSFRLLGCRYDDALLVETDVIGKNGLKTSSGQWEYILKTSRIRNEKDALDLVLTIKHNGGNLSSAGVAVAFDFLSWSTDNYVLIPASVYNGNRNRVVKRDYATGLERSDLYRQDLPMTTVSLPQLSPYPDSLSRLEVNTSYATTPAICFYDKAKKRGFILLTGQGIVKDGKVIDNGLIVEESNDRKTASLVVSAPGVLEKKPEFIGFSKSPYRGIDWTPKDELQLHIRLYTFEAASISDLLEKFMSVRKAVTGQNTPRNLMPFSKISQVMTTDIDKRFYQDEKYQFYCPENANWISFGWIGGLMNTFPMLVMGDEMHRNRVKSTFDFGLTLGQGESGYFYGALNHDGKVFGREGYDETPEIVLTRKNADVLYWMMKQLMLMKAQGHAGEIKPEWEKRVKRLADAFVATWKKDGQWGNFLNNKTGAIAVYNTSGGVMAIGGLALASTYYNESQYMDIAMKAANHYYAEFQKWGMTTGACADILQNADAETAVALMTSLMTLYEKTGQKDWLEKSRQVANLCATWTVSFDYRLPANTPLAKLGAKLTGAVWASTQNKHGAPGFCCSSGDPLFKIYRAVGDERYASLMYDVVHAHAEGIKPNGYITERLTYCDADNKGDRGEGPGGTGWNELNGALMSLEIPGIYLRTDIDRIYVFDHVKAKVSKRTKDAVVLEITNPTAYDASVSYLAETASEAAKPLGVNAFLDWPKIEVKAGETIIYTIKTS